MDTKEVKKIISLVNKIHEKISESNTATSNISATVQENKLEIDKLSRILYEGNGNSVLTKISLIEQRLGQIERRSEEIAEYAVKNFNKCDSCPSSIALKEEKDGAKLIEVDKIRSKYVLYGIIVTTVSSLIVAILGFLL